MHIKKIEKQDLETVSSICMKAFMLSVSPGLSSKGIETFRNTASVDGFLSRMKEDNTILVYKKDDEIKGVVELKEGRHLAMLFVDPNFQKQGIGRALVSAVMPYAKANIVTVSASLNSVLFYTQCGFMCTGESSEASGLKYQPMEMKL